MPGTVVPFPESAAATISDLVQDADDFKPHCLNLIAAGCGAGKSYFVAKRITSLFPDVAPCDILFVTSRTLTVDQQVKEYHREVIKYSRDDERLIARWCGVDEVPASANKLRLMTFDKLIDLLATHNTPWAPPLAGVRVVVIDECHALVGDEFISNIVSVRVWMKMCMHYSDIKFIGLTATEDILVRYPEYHGFPIHSVLNRPIMMYRANRLWVARKSNLVKMLTDGTLPGKTLVLCDDKAELAEFVQATPNSAGLVSRHAAGYRLTMEPIRDYIVEKQMLPSTCVARSGGALEERRLDVLFCTTTMREGVTLIKESGIRNVVTLIPDALHVTQFLGRCRFDVENLVVAYSRESCNRTGVHPYFQEERAKFQDFVFFKSNEWFNSVAHLVRGGLSEVKRYNWSLGEEDFWQYLSATWAVKSVNQVPQDRYITSRDARNEILGYAAKCGVLEHLNGKRGYAALRSYINENSEFRVHETRRRVNGKVSRCDVVTAVGRKEV